jgi:hypothetical protein
MLASMLEAATLLLVVFQAPPESLAFGASLVAGIQEDECPWSPPVSPEIRDAGMLLGDLGDQQVVRLQQQGDRGLASPARADQGDP